MIKTVLITGGTIRIGAAISEEFRRRRWRVLTVSHRADSGADIIADFRETLGPAKAYAAALRLNGGNPPDALINNAALFIGTDEDLNAVNFEAPRKLTTLMAGRETGRGVVVNVLDAAICHTGIVKRRPQAYTDSKRSLYAFTLKAAKMFSDTIDVTFVTPACVLPPTGGVHERAFAPLVSPEALAVEIYGKVLNPGGGFDQTGGDLVKFTDGKIESEIV